MLKKVKGVAVSVAPVVGLALVSGQTFAAIDTTDALGHITQGVTIGEAIIAAMLGVSILLGLGKMLTRKAG